MYHFVVNPASRSGKGIKVWNEIEKYLKESSIEYDVCFSSAHGDVAAKVTDLMSAFSDSTPINVIVLGGDGTLDEALQGITDFNKINIGYIPTGSSNDFARALGYKKNPVDNVKRILSCKEPRIRDLGKLEYIKISDVRSRIQSGDISPIRYFDVSCGIGFDASVCEAALDTGGAKKVLNLLGLGKLIYLKICLDQLFKGETPDGELILDDGRKISVTGLRFVVGMNTCYEGGGFKFAPNAVCDDGYLDLCLASNVSPFKILSLLPSAFKGNHVKSDKIQIFHAKSFEYISKEPLWVHTDGEVATKATHIKVSCEPGVLRLSY